MEARISKYWKTLDFELKRDNDTRREIVREFKMNGRISVTR